MESHIDPKASIEDHPIPNGEKDKTLFTEPAPITVPDDPRPAPPSVTLAGGISGVCVGSVHTCHLCRGPHYYSLCKQYYNEDIVCFVNDVDEKVYAMQHESWSSVTMGDVYAIIKSNMNLTEEAVRLVVATVETSQLPHHFLASNACITPGVVVVVKLRESHVGSLQNQQQQQRRGPQLPHMHSATTPPCSDGAPMHNDLTDRIEPSNRRVPFAQLIISQHSSSLHEHRVPANSLPVNDSQESQQTTVHIPSDSSTTLETTVDTHRGKPLRHLHPIRSRPLSEADAKVSDAERIRRTVHIKFVPATMTAFEMREMFDRGGGTVMKVRITKQFRDVSNVFAFVEYATIHDATRAIGELGSVRVGPFRLLADYPRSCIKGRLDTDATEENNNICTFGRLDGGKAEAPETLCIQDLRMIQQQQNNMTTTALQGGGLLHSSPPHPMQGHSILKTMLSSAVNVAAVVPVIAAATIVSLKSFQDLPAAVVGPRLRSISSSSSSANSSGGRGTPSSAEQRVKPLFVVSSQPLPSADPAPRAAQSDTLKMIQSACSSYVLDPTESAYFAAFDHLITREQQIAAVSALPISMIEQHQVSLLHISILLHHGNPADTIAAAALCRMMLVPLMNSAVGRASDLHIVEQMLHLGLLFEENTSPATVAQTAELPLLCYECAHVLSKKLFGPSSFPALETARLIIMAKSLSLQTSLVSSTSLLAHFLPGVRSYSSLILHGSVTISFW